MFSQRNEELYIVEFFKGVYQGRFLDIGAYDGKTFSNTHQLALQGWDGVCIEPSPSVFPALQKRYENNNRIQVRQVAIGDITGKKEFYDSGGDAISSFDVEHVKKWESNGGKNYSKVMVDCLTVDALFADIKYDFDFVNIDTEGLSLYILERLPFVRLYKMKMICIEYDKNLERILKVIKEYEFEKLVITAENVIVVRKQ